MARFRAFTSDSSEDESDHVVEEKKTEGALHDESEDESNSGSDSFMEEDELVKSPPPQKRFTRSALVQNKSGDYRYAHESEDESEDEASSSDSPPPTRARVGDPSLIPWAQQVGVDAQKMLVMQTSLFRMPEEAAALKEIEKPTRHWGLRVSPQGLNRKHSRDSEGDGLRVESRERASFADDIDPVPHRPSRKYARVDITSSVSAGAEGAVIDAGLALGRSWRVGWGPGGTLVHLGKLCGPTSSSDVSTNSSIIHKTSLPLVDETNLSSKLLQHHLSNSPIEADENGIPFANPSFDLCFASFTGLFTSTDESYIASLFRLGHALFDPLNLRLGESTPPDARNRIICLRRKAALSSWLERAVSQKVEATLKSPFTLSPPYTAFILLTGNQVEKACEVAMDGGYYKLATLISQAGGDAEFQEDLREQLQLWREQRIDVHIDEGIRKVYALLAGIVDDVVPGSKGTGLACSDIDITRGLDWKRMLGLHLWFSEPLDTTISDVYEAYVELSKQSLPTRKIAQPVPWYSTSTNLASQLWKLPDELPPDGLFALIRLHAEPSCSLSQVLLPLSFGPSPLDFTLPWHLYVLLSRCMRARDFDDRGDPVVPEEGDDDDENTVEGHSPSADLLTSSYALQLERLGMIQEALFVLLHIEGSHGREKVVKDLLARSASKLDEWMIRGIIGSLKIPMTWVNEAKAIHAYDNGRLYDAYELYYSAAAFNAAHDIAVVDLAPDAIIRKDLELLRDLFVRFEGKPVDGWHEPDTAEDDIEELSRTASKLIGLLPDVLCNRKDVRHAAALAEMVATLVSAVEKLRPLALSQVRLTHASIATKQKHLRSITHERFLRSIAA
ncbi:Nuclear pore complex protein NUP96 C-terminal domain-containing protein [Pleurotus pulmonarius]